LYQLCDIAAEQTPRSSCFGATNIFIKVLLEKKYALRKSPVSFVMAQPRKEPILIDDMDNSLSGD
jgi:hypothetical protein